MSDTPFCNQFEQNIYSLLATGKLKEAYRLCNELIARYPTEDSLVYLRKKIEDEIKKTNKEKINEQIEKFESMWDKKEYPELIQELYKILQVDPDNKKVRHLHAKAQKLYKKHIEKLAKEFEKEKIKQFSELLKENPDKLISELFLLERSNPQNIKIKALIQEYRIKIVHKKIKERSDLLNSDKYMDIENFLARLKKIDEKNEEILKLEKKIRERKNSNQINEKKEYLYTANEHLNTLMKLKKYDKAIIAAEEILGIDKNKNKVKKILKLAKRKFYNETKNIVIDQILKAGDRLKNNYQKNEKEFVKF